MSLCHSFHHTFILTDPVLNTSLRGVRTKIHEITYKNLSSYLTENVNSIHYEEQPVKASENISNFLLHSYNAM